MQRQRSFFDEYRYEMVNQVLSYLATVPCTCKGELMIFATYAIDTFDAMSEGQPTPGTMSIATSRIMKRNREIADGESTKRALHLPGVLARATRTTKM